MDIFLSSITSLFFLPLSGVTARYRLKYCLKGPLSLKQPTNQNCFATIGIIYLMKLDNVCATFLPEVANSSCASNKNILNEIIFFLNHRLNILKLLNVDMEIKIYTYLKDLSFYRLSDTNTDICVWWLGEEH